MLATRADGQGAHYQFMGFKPGRYTTYAYVLVQDGEQTILVLPEWHAARPVHLPSRVLPPAAAPGDWLRCSAELDAPHAGRLAIRDFGIVADPGRETCPAPEVRAEPVDRATTPAFGEHCGDIVIRLDPATLENLAQLPRRELYLSCDPPAVEPGGTLFVADGRHVYGAVEIVGLRRSPMGSTLELDRAVRRLDPLVGVGEQRLAPWAWRWWDSAC